MTSVEQVAELERGELDIALTYATEPVDDALATHDLAWGWFSRPPIDGVLVAADHALASRERGMTSPPAPVPTAGARGMAVRPLLLGSTAAGQAWMPTSHRLADAYHASRGVVYRPFVEAPLPFGLILAWRRTETAVPVLAFLRLAGVVADGAPALPR